MPRHTNIGCGKSATGFETWGWDSTGAGKIDGKYKSVNKNAGVPVPDLNGVEWGFAQTRDGRGIVA